MNRQRCDEQGILDEGRRPFDLRQTNPPWRVRLIHSNDSQQLVWTFHHIGFDEASIATLLHEFGLLYRGESLSEDPIRQTHRHQEPDETSRAAWWDSKLG